MKRLLLSGLLILAGAPLHAMSVDAHLSVNVHLRAGPDIGYPAIDVLPAGAMVRIEGCTQGWAWCDVRHGSERGWIAGNFILHDYGGQPVPITAYGPRLGIPTISFSIVTYWDRHYVGRPFYRERERWYRQPPPRHAPPPHRRAPPPGHRSEPSPQRRSGHGRATEHGGGPSGGAPDAG